MNPRLFITLLFVCAVLSGCESTSPTQVVHNVTSEEQTLQQTVNQYPKDSLALQKLIDYQMNEFDASPSPQILNRLFQNLETGMALSPSERYFPFHYYRLGLNEAFMTHNFNQSKWQDFYDQYPFLATLDLAPPVYMPYLLSDMSPQKQELIFKQSMHDNPAFMNAYIDLAYLYYQQDKLELAIFVLESARKRNNENTEITSDWIHYRANYLHNQMCERAIPSEGLDAILDESRRLTQMDPTNALYQVQLADAFRDTGKYQLAGFAAAKAAKLDDSFESYKMEVQLWNLQVDKILSSNFDQNHEDADATLTRIYSQIAAGNINQAAKLADAYNKLDDARFYGVIYGSYGYVLDQASQQALFSALRRDYALEKWHKVMLRFAENKIDEQTLLAKASNRCERSEALFIAALNHMALNDATPLTPYWQEIVELDVKSFYEFAVARYQLKQAN